MTLRDAVVASIVMLWTKRNRPESDVATRDTWMAVLGRWQVTPVELEDAVAYFLDVSPYFPDVSEVLERIKKNRQLAPTVAVLTKDGRVSLVHPDKAVERYVEIWGCEPKYGLHSPPTLSLGSSKNLELPDLTKKIKDD